VKIYVAAVKALRKKEGRKEGGMTLTFAPKKLLVGKN
jgi:hypothetical protein